MGRPALLPGRGERRPGAEHAGDPGLNAHSESAEVPAEEEALGRQLPPLPPQEAAPLAFRAWPPPPDDERPMSSWWARASRAWWPRASWSQRVAACWWSRRAAGSGDAPRTPRSGPAR